MATVKNKGVISGPLKKNCKEAEEYHQNTLKQLEYGKGRSIETAYGSTWAYKLGPSDGSGPKVLFIHGINTSCHSLADIAVPLSNSGCQVLLYDLYGRGLSDGTTAKHDEKLYVHQAAAVLESFGWKEDFTVVGYSMGGSLAVCLNQAMPDLITNLILLAPAGLIRRRTFGLEKIAAFRSPMFRTKKRHRLIEENLEGGIEKVRTKKHQVVPPVEGQQTVDLEEAVCVHGRKWLMDNHDGFIQAISDSVSHAPLYGQEKVWGELRARKGATMIVLGSRDDKVVLSEFKEDVRLLEGGAGHLHLKILEGADHHFPMTDARKVLAIIAPVLGVAVKPK